MSGDLFWLTIVFCLIALLYSSVGFGGGSSYTALLAIAGFSAATIPVIALSCNLIVATGGAWRFIREGHFPWRRMAPLFVLSLPMAYLAGRYEISPAAYFLLLAIALGVAAVLLWKRRTVAAPEELRPLPCVQGLGIGAGLGALSGLTGIGGGIYLSPVLMLRSWAMPKEAAGTAAVYIVVNSFAGLLGQLSKDGSGEHVRLLIPLGAAVLVGGTIGSRLGAKILPPAVIQKGTALLVAAVALRIFYNSIILIT